MKNPQASIKAFCLSILFVIAISNPTFAQQPSASVGGKCTKVGLKSGTSTTPLVCEKVGNKLKWVKAPGGKCSEAGTLAGTVKNPWVCRKLSGKLQWVTLNNAASATATTTVTSPVMPTISPGVQTPKTTTVTSPVMPTISPGVQTPTTIKTTTTTTTTTTTVATTTIPVVCPNSENVTSEITSASDGGFRTTGNSLARDYYFTRNVEGVIRNSSGVSISVVTFSLAGNLLRLGAVVETKTVGVANNVDVKPGGTYGWSVSYEALPHRNVWSDYTNVVRNETVKTLSFVSSDLRCP
jgi:hypothetical protein